MLEHARSAVSSVDNALQRRIYTVSQKKTSPTFLAVNRENIIGFSNVSHTC